MFRLSAIYTARYRDPCNGRVLRDLLTDTIAYSMDRSKLESMASQLRDGLDEDRMLSLWSGWSPTYEDVDYEVEDVSRLIV